MLAGALISHHIVKESHSVAQISPDSRRSCGHLAGIVRLSKQTWLHDWRRYAMLLCLRSGGPDCSYEMRWFDAMSPARSVTKDVSLHLDYGYHI
jgi:hypothetical protein